MAAKKILVIAAEKFLRDLIQGYLERMGAQVLAVGSGREGLALARAELPNLIVADVPLPDLPAPEFLQQLKADLKTKAFPVLIVLAGDQPAEGQRCREAGAAEAVSKPIKPRQLLQRTAKLLGIPVRYSMHLPATVSAAAGAGMLPFKAEVKDLSETGIRIATHLKLALNSPVRIQFQLPARGGELSLEAKIIRLEAGEQGEMTYGLRFLAPDPQQRDRIRNYLQSLPVKISL